MGLDRADMQFISGLMKDQKDTLMEAISLQGSGTRAVIESEVNRIDAMDKIRNGKINKNCADIEDLHQETKVLRWCERNKKITALILIVGMLTVAFGYHTVNFKRTIEKALHIELKEEEGSPGRSDLQP